MTVEVDLKLYFQSLKTAVAVADVETWSIIFENAKFFHWFSPAGEEDDEGLASRLTGLKVDRARSRLSSGRPYIFETEVRSGPRSVSLSVEMRRDAVDGHEFVLVECQDVSKQKEAEYMLDTYSRMAEKNARELQREKERVEKLLLNIMPQSVYEEMKEFGTSTPQRFDAASVLMLDFVDFTNMAISRDPSALVAELNDIFSAFDRIVDLFGCERIKTIGDAYVAVSGLPEANPEHATNIARVALRMRRYLERRNMSNPNQWTCRIGISTGPLIGSLVGIQKYVYDIFGPAVNLAARLEAISEPMQITVAEETVKLIEDEFGFSDRGEFDLKGFGRMSVFALERETRGPR